MKRLFIVDTENTNNYSFISEYKLTNDDTIALFISNKMKGIKDDGCLELFNTKAKIIIESVEVGDKNSLDFQIIVYLSERTFRGRYDDIYIVSNDCGYKQAINYLNSKFNKSISIVNYNKIYENIEPVEIVSKIIIPQTTESIEDLIQKLIPKIAKKDISKIINVKNESISLMDFHNRMSQAFGTELGRELYSKLKSNLKNLF